MLRFGLFLSVLLMLQSSCCASDDVQDEEESEVTNSHEIVDSFPSRSYDAVQYPWRLWNFPYYYQPRIPQNPAGSPPEVDPRFVTNKCNSRQSYTPTTTYPCFTSFVTFFFTTTTTTTITTSTLSCYSTTPYSSTTFTPTTEYTTSTGTTSTDTTTTSTTSEQAAG